MEARMLKLSRADRRHALDMTGAHDRQGNPPTHTPTEAMERAGIQADYRVTHAHLVGAEARLEMLNRALSEALRQKGSRVAPIIKAAGEARVEIERLNARSDFLNERLGRK